LIQQNKKNLSTIKELPDVPEDTVGLVYVEIHGFQEEQVEVIADDLLSLSTKWHNDPESSWALLGETDVKKLKAFRHAAPEIVNLVLEKAHLQDKRITKLSTDMKCDGVSLRSVITKYESDLLAADLKACIFGHIEGNHLHINIIPEDFDQYQKGKAVLEKWAKNVANQNGRVITEHGIGKLKKEIFLTNTNPAIIQSIKQFKKDFDPPFMWNRGNILADDE
jgi:D-lactate dehydrogenase (cytochrome)